MEGNVPSLCSGDPRLAGFNACSLFMETEKTARPAAGRTITAGVASDFSGLAGYVDGHIITKPGHRHGTFSGRHDDTVTAVVDDIGTWQRTAEGRPEQRASLSLGNNRVGRDVYPDFSGRVDKCELCCIGLPGFSQMSGGGVADVLFQGRLQFLEWTGDKLRG